MKNFVQKGDVVTLTAPAGGVVGGNGYLLGALFGVAEGDAVAADTFSLQTVGVVELPKAAVAVAEGALVYWDNTAKNVTTTATSNKLIGHCALLGGSLAGDATTFVRLQTN